MPRPPPNIAAKFNALKRHARSVLGHDPQTANELNSRLRKIRRAYLRAQSPEAMGRADRTAAKHIADARKKITLAKRMAPRVQKKKAN